MIRNILILSVLCLFSCGTDSPKEMAHEYCKCFYEGMEDGEKMKECAELAKEHKEKLAKDPEKMKKYSDEVMRCVVFENIP
ncbi:MAG: hypothetical protein ACOZCO_06005 [Bacteroidota bacterium]